MGAWQFFQDEILGMKWLNRLIGNVLSLLGLDIDGRLGGSVQFFLYDVIKITVLLCLLIFVISYIQSYFPPERSKKILGRFHGIGANIISALLGTVTPFCSCSSIPLFMGFTSAGLPLGVTFSFLISSPMVDLGSFGQQQPLRGAPGDSGGRADVRGYFRHHPCGGGPAGKGRAAWHNPGLYDGGHNAESAIIIMLRKAVKPKLLALFVGVCTAGIILVGYLFNVFQFIII